MIVISRPPADGLTSLISAGMVAIGALVQEFVVDRATTVRPAALSLPIARNKNALEATRSAIKLEVSTLTSPWSSLFAMGRTSSTREGGEAALCEMEKFDFEIGTVFVMTRLEEFSLAFCSTLCKGGGPLASAIQERFGFL